MKKIIYFFCMLPLAVFSQNFVCGENQQEILDKFNQHSNTAMPVVYDANTKYVFNVFYHVVYNDDGVTRTNSLGDPGIPIDFDEVMNSIRDLNIHFNQFNIFFKYRGFDKINNTSALIIETSTELTAIRNQYSLPSMFNIFVVNGSVYNAYARGDFFDDEAFIDTWVKVHEMGHLFSLVHPNFYQGDCNIWEHAPRDVNAPDFNADVAGDQVVDTHIEVSSSYIDSNCDYIGGGVDCLGNSVLIETVNGYTIKPGYDNFMYVTGTTACTPKFTPGQIRRMREAITGYWATYYQEKMTTIESLYQPFETTYIGGSHIVSTEDLGNGYAKVCRNRLEKHRFQKGFDCVFPNNDGNPDLIATAPDDIPVDINHTSDYPMIINQIDPLNPAYVNVVCTKGVVCDEEEFIAGIDFIADNLGGYLFTIEEWDNLKVKDPQLYENLQSGKYHIIKKETKSGIVIEVTLFKP